MTTSSDDRRPLQALWLIILTLLGGVTLVSLAGLTSRCGDGRSSATKCTSAGARAASAGSGGAANK